MENKTPYELWKQAQKENHNKAWFKQALKANGILVPKCKNMGCINPIDFESNSKYCMACFTSNA